MLVCIDPGLRECGVAVFQGGKLVGCAIVKNTEKKARGKQAWKHMASEVRKYIGDALVVRFVAEKMELYRDHWYKWKDLFELQGVLGACAYALDAVEEQEYLPKEWKKSVPKPIHNARTFAKLSPDEQACLAGIPESMKNHVLDAIGLGLVDLKRVLP